jgi:hypothetical protein
MADVTIHPHGIETEVTEVNGTIWFSLKTTSRWGEDKVTFFVMDTSDGPGIGLNAAIAAVATLESQLLALRDGNDDHM